MKLSKNLSIRKIRKPRKSRVQPIGILTVNNNIPLEGIAEMKEKWNKFMSSSNLRSAIIYGDDIKIQYVRKQQEPRFIAHFKAVKKLQQSYNFGRVRVSDMFLSLDTNGVCNMMMSSMLQSFQIKNVYKEKENEVVLVGTSKYFDVIPEASLIPFYEFIFKRDEFNITRLQEVKKL